MKKLKFEGIEYAIKKLNQKINISIDDFSKQFIDKKADIRIEILEDGKVVNGITTQNLIRGLIVCSNHYLPESVDLEDIRDVKTKFEKTIRKGVVAKIEKVNNKDSLIRLIIEIKGKDKYTYYSENFINLLHMVEETKKVVQNSL